MHVNLARPTVAFLVPADWEEMHAAQAYKQGILGPLQSAITQAGYYLDLCRLSESGQAQDIEEFETYLNRQRPVGFIVGRVLEQDPVVDLLRQERIPFVLFGHNSQSDDVDWIDVDNEAAFWLSTRKCIDAGHREIALLNGPEPYSYARQRELGYRKALRQSGIQLDTELILNGEPTFAMGSVMASYLLRSMQRPTALVCATDELALGAMSACTDLGLRVGRDISVVGYGDTEQARKSTPRLATLSFSLRGISQQLADSLLSQLEPQRFNRVNSRRLVPVYWIEGASLRGPMQVGVTGASRVYPPSDDSISSAQLRAEIASRNRTQQIVHAGSWRFDPTTQQFSGSPEFNAIFGAARDQQVGLPQIGDLLTADSVRSFEAAWYNAGHGRGLDIEVQADVGGVPRFLQWRGEFVCNRGIFVYAEGAVQDVTDLVYARQELRKSNREAEIANQAKDQFLANMSHEIRTPIHAVMGLTEVLKRQLEEQSEARATVEKISKASASLLNIINDILLVSKVESGMLELERYPFDLQQLVDEISASAEGLLSTKSVSFRAPQIDSNLRFLIGDPERLKQVLLNLVGNACKFTASGSVELVVKHAPTDRVGLQATLLFEVRDTGIGIAQSRLAELFNPFSQADRSTSRLYGGTGLGLTIAQSLVTMMGGELAVESEPGEGSRFFFELDFQLGTSNTVQLNQADQLRVMIVDDSASAALYTSEIVRELSWLPSLFETGQTALTEIESDPTRYDLVLLDYRMPGMSGYEVARELRNIPGAQQLALILISAEDISALPEPLSGYVDQILAKPLTAEKLLTAVSELDQPSMPATQPHERVEETLVGIRILAIDDSEINLELLEDMLTSLGAEVDCALSAAQGLDLIQDQNRYAFDAVLCDLQMPMMDGFEFTKKLHSIREFETMPVAAVSAGVDVLRQQQAGDAGMQAYLQKPFGSKELADLVLSLVGESDTPALSAEKSIHASTRPQTKPRDASSDTPFDPAAGQKYWSKPATYLGQLRYFVEHYSAFDFSMELISGEHYDSALNYSHKLKGVAAVLGLQALSESAKELELLLRQPKSPDLVTKARNLAVVQSRLHRESIAAVEGWLATQLTDQSSVTELPKLSLIKLRMALQSFDPVAAEKCLMVDVEGVSDSVMAELRDAVSQFDFKRALKLVESEQRLADAASSDT